MAAQPTPPPDGGAGSSSSSSVAAGSGTPSSSSATASPPAAVKKPALYCTPHVRLPGSVSVNAETVLFEPDLQHECVREFGVGEYQIFLEVRDVIDCGAMAMSLEDSSGQDADRVAHFLQLHVRTLDGRQFCHPEDAEHAWCVVFWMRSREDLRETARCLIAHLDVLRRSDTPKPSRRRSRTSVPFACLDCMSEFEAASARRRSSELQGCTQATPAPSAHGRSSGGGSPAPSPEPSFSQGPELVAGDVERPLLREAMAALLSDYLPVVLRVAGNVEWRLAYTPKVHGVSIQTFYRMLGTDATTVLIVRDSTGNVFGGFGTQPWTPGGLHGFFGTGESFVFSFGAAAAEESHLQLRCYTWCGHASNQFFQYADHEYFAMGGGAEGRHALAIKDDFLHGFSHRSSTFENAPLSSQEEFVISDLEVWALREKSEPRPDTLDLRG